MFQINDKECLPVLSCSVEGDMQLKLDKGAAMRLMQDNTITAMDVLAEFTYYKTDHMGRIYYTIPLRLVPRLWVLKLLRRLGFTVYRYYGVFDQYSKITTKTVSDKITSFKIGVAKTVSE